MQHTSNIVELLTDTAFPQMLLIDGSWGSGKTHFIKTELAPALKYEFSNHELHYFSLYGVSSIEDFRDRLISLTMTNNTETSNFVQRATQLADSLATNMGERGIGGILNGAAGAYKYKLYSGLNNCILLLDDLERVSNDKTIKDILGECLNLAESKNIKIIVIANESKLSCKDDVEKVFIDKVKFSYTSGQVAEILREDFQDELPEYLYNELVLHINSTGSSNIRVLKRALIKFKKLKVIISAEPGISLEIALSKTLRQVINICYAKFEAGYTSKEIKTAAKTYMTRMLIKDDGPSNTQNEKEKELDRILGGDVGHEYLVDFCCDSIFRFENIMSELRLPTEKRLIDKVMNYSLLHQLSECDFIEGVKALTSLVHDDENLQINEWFNACDTLVYLIDNNYLSSEISRQQLINICKNKNIDCFDSDKVPDRGAWGGFYNNDIYKLYNEKLSVIRESIKLSDNTDFTLTFSSSWSDLESEMYQHFSHTPFLQNIGVEGFIKAINTWSASDVYRFTGYMKEKYNFNNIEEFLQPEHIIIQGAIEKLEKITSEPSLKFGAILGLKEALGNINTAMIERLTIKSE
jgi:hypothetical protein